MRLDEWQKFIESQFVEAGEDKVEFAAVDGHAGPVAVAAPVLSIPIAEDVPGGGQREHIAAPNQNTEHGLEKASSSPKLSFPAVSDAEPSISTQTKSANSEPEEPVAKQIDLPPDVRSLHTQPDENSDGISPSIRIHAEPGSLAPTELPLQNESTPRRRLTQSIAAHPVFTAETLGRASAAGSQPILSSPSRPAATENPASSASRKAEQLRGIYTSPDNAARVDQPQHFNIQNKNSEDLKETTLSEFYVEIPAFASYLPDSHAAHSNGLQKTADPATDNKSAEQRPSAELPIAEKPVALPEIRESVLTPQIDIPVKIAPPARRVTADSRAPEPSRDHPQASVPRTVTVVAAGKSGNTGIVSSVSISSQGSAGSSSVTTVDKPKAAGKKGQTEPAESIDEKKPARTESRRRLFGVSVPAYTPSAALTTDASKLGDKTTGEPLAAAHSHSDPHAEIVESTEHSTLQPADMPSLDETSVSESRKLKTRYARNVIPQSQNVPLANSPREPSAAELWATVPRHVQSLLSLERQEQETAQSSYKRPFQEKRHELIERLLDPILSLEDAARLLNVCPTTVRRYTNKGILTCYRKETEHSSTAPSPSDKETRQRRFRLSDILAFLEAQQSALAADRLAELNAPGLETDLCVIEHE